MSDDRDKPLGHESRANADLVGHVDAERILLHAAVSDQMPHAWLIAGPEGIGKATLAYRFARWLLAGAPRGSDLSIAPSHPVFAEVVGASHPDLRVLVREVNEKTGRLRSEIAVEQARDAIRFLHMHAARGSWRVVIIDPVDDLSPEAANALLKAIEEPPRRALFLLVSHAASAILPTIRSRCRRLDLHLLGTSELKAVLAQRMPELSGDADALARMAEGSPGKALALAASGGLDMLATVETVLAGLPNLDIAALERVADQAARGGEESMAVMRDVLLWWLIERVRADAKGGPLTRLDRWAALWENSARLFARAEAASLDRKQALLEIFYDIEFAARAA